MKRLQTPLLMPLLSNPKIKDFLISYVRSPYMTKLLDFLGNSAALLGVMQGRDTKPGAEETSKTVLRKFPRKSIVHLFQEAAHAFSKSL